MSLKVTVRGDSGRKMVFKVRDTEKCIQAGAREQLWGPPASQRSAEKEEPVKKIDLEQPELNKGTEEETSHKPREDISRRRG